MDAYVLGKHDGDLPTHLLSGPGGNRVRAMARLDGPHHDAFYALEVDDPDGVTVLIESLTDAGLIVSKTHLPTAHRSHPWDFLEVRPSHIPPWEYYLFVYGEGIHELPADLGPILEELEEGTVAAAVGNDGSILIELGSNDEAAVAAAGARVAEALGGDVATHAVVGSGIISA